MAAVALVAGASVGGAQPPAGVAELRWLAGCWQSRAGALVVEEHWLAPLGGVVLGVSRTTRGDSLVGFEYMRIHARGDTVLLVAQPSGAPPVEFTARRLVPREAEFENPAHDFPQRIRYRAAGTDSLLARIGGTVGGRERRIDFPYVRAVCPAAEPRTGTAEAG